MADFETMSTEEYKEMKDKERNEVFEMLSDSTQKLMNKEEFIKYLDLQAQFFTQTTSNVLLIKEQRPEAAWIKTADEWNKHGIFINKGEKGIKVLRAKSYQKSDGSIGTGFEVGKVFDIKQTSAADRPISTREYPDLLESLMHRAPCMVAVLIDVPDGGNACYDHDQEVIFVKEGLGKEECFLALARELSCCEFMNMDYSKTREEVLPFAECSAYMLAKKYGLEVPAPDVSGLIEHFSGKEEKEVRKELSDTKQVAAILSSRIMDHQRSIQEEINAGR